MKPFCADDSVGPPHVKVGHRRVLIPKKACPDKGRAFFVRVVVRQACPAVAPGLFDAYPSQPVNASANTRPRSDTSTHCIQAKEPALVELPTQSNIARPLCYVCSRLKRLVTTISACLETRGQIISLSSSRYYLHGNRSVCVDVYYEGRIRLGDLETT